jgi:hypothetical protein
MRYKIIELFIFTYPTKRAAKGKKPQKMRPFQQLSFSCNTLSAQTKSKTLFIFSAT